MGFVGKTGRPRADGSAKGLEMSNKGTKCKQHSWMPIFDDDPRKKRGYLWVCWYCNRVRKTLDDDQ